VRIVIFILFLFSFAGDVFAQPVEDKLKALRSGELLELLKEGKDGTYEVTKKFAECAGLFEALSNYLTKYEQAKVMAKTLRNTGRGAKFTATFFWSSYSKNPKAAVEAIIGGSADYYASIISIGGIENKTIIVKMNYCASISSLQALVIDELRKTY